MDDNIKFLHIFTTSTLIHNKSIIRMINEDSLGFEKSEHVFIMKHRSNYEALKEYNNVIWDELIISNSMKKFKEYAKKSTYIFLHCNELTYFELLHLKKEDLKKIIWCIWGHDLYYVWQPLNQVSGFYRKSKKLLLNVINRISYTLRKSRSKHMMAIGISFKYDAIEIRKRFRKTMPIFLLPYGYIPNKLEEIQKIKEEDTQSTDTRVKIMIGHSAYKFLNHIKILDKLKKFKNENIIISLVLSYGNQNYAENVAEYALEIFQDKVEIIRENMSYHDYLQYLKGINICIFDYLHQSAVGNIWRLLFLEKKIFLNKNGILKTALLLEGVETYNVEDIDHMNFDDFKKPIEKRELNYKVGTDYIDENICVDMWKNSLRELK